MSSILQWARSKRPRAVVNLGVDSYDDMSFSWSGIKLFVDLGICPRDLETVGGIGHTPIKDNVVQPSKDATEECGSPPHPEPEPIKDTLLEINENSEKECDKQQPTDLETCGVKDDPDRNYFQSAWPDWGEPLPPEEDDDNMTVESADEVDKSEGTKKAVTFSDAITVLEPSSLQEVRETGSFSFSGSSDDELELGTDQVTSSNQGHSNDLSDSRVSSTEKEAAYHLLELGNELKCGGFENGMESSAVSRRGKGEFYDPSYDLERLSELLEKIYAATPELSILSGSQGSVFSEVGSWKIEVSKDSGRFRMKRIKRDEAESDRFGFDGLDDENDVLERPPWKRHYKSLNKLLKCGKTGYIFQ